ncbi:MAG TPA: cupin domain-containing protein, partial [Spirillospora sp.]|nr:cupin domain-containing protein [Spirillospora sp.]
QGICMHFLSIPPGGRAKAHLHENHETAIYVLQGEAEMWYGENLSERLVVKAGEFLYIPAGMPHLPANLSQTEPCVAVLARTDPNEQESVTLLPELDARINSI